MKGLLGRRLRPQARVNVAAQEDGRRDGGKRCIRGIVWPH